MQLSILVVNYNTESFIKSFLLDLKSQTLSHKNFEIILVNNVQNKYLNEVIEQSHELNGLNIRIIDSESNVGFGRAMNLGAEHAQGKELLIANPDLRMMQTDYLEQLLTYSKQSENYGLITTRQLNDDNKDTSEYKNYEFHENLIDGQSTNWFCGALLLIKKSVFDQINGFDPDFFMYCEDEDLSVRIKKTGLPLIKINELAIYHKGGSSEPYHNYAFYHRWFKSKILFAHKHYPTNIFNQILNQIENKAKGKTRLYSIVAITGIKKYQSRKDKWKAMLDCVQKTKNESIQWLFLNN